MRVGLFAYTLVTVLLFFFLYKTTHKPLTFTENEKGLVFGGKLTSSKANMYELSMF